MISQNQKVWLSSITVKIDRKPVLEPGEVHCYPYENTFYKIAERGAKYKSVSNITITNYLGLEFGTDHCPGTDSCSFGLNVIADFKIPEP
jgi:hypothetical protein